MRSIGFAAASLVGLLTACSSSSSSQPPSLYGNWDYIDSAGTAGNGLTLKSDGTYVVSRLVLTSSTSANAQVESGTMVVTGSTIAFTPQNWSCEEPKDPPYTATYQLTNGGLEVTLPGLVIAFQVNTSPVATNFTLATGCFPQSGGFVPSPLSPVGSCSGAGATCAGSAVCCLGFTCVTTNGGSCAASCTQDSQCASGCCTQLSNAAESVCGPCPDAGP
jgi:hypothetical protein